MPVKPSQTEAQGLRRSAEEVSGFVAVYGDEGWAVESLPVPAEEPVTLTLNGRELVTMLSSPGERRELAVGFLYAEGILDDLNQLREVEVTDQGVEVTAAGVDLGVRLFDRRVLGSGCGKATSFVTGLDALAAGSRRLPSQMPWVSPAAVVAATQELYGGKGGRSTTRGTHAAGLFSRDGALVALTEDIGRHNAIDKVIGRCLLTGRSLEDVFLVVTGRISSEMAAKVGRTPIPLVVSKSVPTALAVEYARRLYLGVAGRVRRSGMVVYSWPELIGGPPGQSPGQSWSGAEASPGGESGTDDR